jgi:hypothetical protein
MNVLVVGMVLANHRDAFRSKASSLEDSDHFEGLLVIAHYGNTNVLIGHGSFDSLPQMCEVDGNAGRARDSWRLFEMLCRERPLSDFPGIRSDQEVNSP